METDPKEKNTDTDNEFYSHLTQKGSNDEESTSGTTNIHPYSDSLVHLPHIRDLVSPSSSSSFSFSSSPNNPSLFNPSQTHPSLFSVLPLFAVPLSARPHQDLHTAALDPQVKDQLQQQTLTKLHQQHLLSDLQTSILIYGPKGSGKTHITGLVANTIHASLFSIRLSKIVSDLSLLENFFIEARQLSQVCPVCIVIDHCEAMLDQQAAGILNSLESIRAANRSAPLFLFFIARPSAHQQPSEALAQFSDVHIRVPSPSLDQLKQCIRINLKDQTLNLGVSDTELNDSEMSIIMSSITKANVYSFNLVEKFVKQSLLATITRVSDGGQMHPTLEAGDPRLKPRWCDFESQLFIFSRSDGSHKSSLITEDKSDNAIEPLSPHIGPDSDNPNQPLRSTENALPLLNTPKNILISSSIYDKHSETRNHIENLQGHSNSVQIIKEEENDADMVQDDEGNWQHHGYSSTGQFPKITHPDHSHPHLQQSKIKRGRTKRKHNSMTDIINNYDDYLFKMNDEERKTVPPSTKHDMEILWFGNQCINNFIERFPNVTAARNYIRNNMSTQLTRWREAGKPVDRNTLLEAVYGKTDNTNSESELSLDRSV